MATREATAVTNSQAMNNFVEVYNMLCAKLGIEESPFSVYAGGHEHRRALALLDLSTKLKEHMESYLAQSETIVIDVKLEK